MNLKEIIRAGKHNLEIGEWKEGHIPRAKFPMSRVRDKNYKFGPEYSWRLVKFDAVGLACRVLILLNENKGILRGRLGIEQGGDMIVLCEYEYHAGEPGWHCHLTLDPVTIAAKGAVRFNKTKWPRSPSRLDFGATKANALTLVAARFRFSAQGALI